jgi:hypothetical protein
MTRIQSCDPIIVVEFPASRLLQQPAVLRTIFFKNSDKRLNIQHYDQAQKPVLRFNNRISIRHLEPHVEANCSVKQYDFQQFKRVSMHANIDIYELNAMKGSLYSCSQVSKFHHFMKPELTLQCSQKLSTGRHLE